MVFANFSQSEREPLPTMGERETEAAEEVPGEDAAEIPEMKMQRKLSETVKARTSEPLPYDLKHILACVQLQKEKYTEQCTGHRLLQSHYQATTVHFVLTLFQSGHFK